MKTIVSQCGDVWKQMEHEVMKYNKSQASWLELMAMGWYSLWGAMGIDFGYNKVFANVWRYYFREPKSVPEANREWLNGIRAKAVNETRKSLVKLNDDKLKTKFSKVNKPVLLTYGKFDIYGPSRLSQEAALTFARHVEFDDAGHLAWIQDKDRFETEMLRFFEQAKQGESEGGRNRE